MQMDSGACPAGQSAIIQRPPGNIQQPSRAHQDKTVTIQHALGNNSNHPLGSKARGLIPKISFISKDQFQKLPLLILAIPPKNPSNKSPCGRSKRKKHFVSSV